MDAVLYKKMQTGIIDLVNAVPNLGIVFTNERGQTKNVTLSVGHNRIELEAFHTWEINNTGGTFEIEPVELSAGRYVVIEI